MVLRHEEEHRSARDPHLLFVSVVLIALMPWNIPMWWLARRLRLAIELDCDARVLRAHPRPERYGLLLLTIAQRHAGVTPRFSPALSEPTSHLERRIIAMRIVASRFTRTRVLAFGAVAAAAIAIACSVPAPDSATGPDAGAQVSADLHVRISAGRKGSNGAALVNESGAQRTYIDSMALQPARPLPGNPLPAYPPTLAAARVNGSGAQRSTPVNANQTYYSFQVEKQTQPVDGNPTPKYPSKLESARVGGEVLVQFVVDTMGQVDMSQFKVLKASDPLFVDAVRSVIPEWKFSPAHVGGYTVKQLVQMPFTFKVP
jgi:TonB family protein